MAGKGQRFLDKGISTPKPLLKIDSEPFISHVIKSLIDQGNWKQLSLLFEENSLFIHNHRTVVARMATSLHFNVINLPKGKLGKVSVLLKNKNFRDLAIYMWVDYDHANGYFGRLVESSIQHLVGAEEKLFSQLYLRKVAFLNLTEFNIDYKNISPNIVDRIEEEINLLNKKIEDIKDDLMWKWYYCNQAQQEEIFRQLTVN